MVNPQLFFTHSKLYAKASKLVVSFNLFSTPPLQPLDPLLHSAHDCLKDYAYYIYIVLCLLDAMLFDPENCMCMYIYNRYIYHTYTFSFRDIYIYII